MTLTHFALLSLFPALMAYAACSDLLSMRISNRVSLLLFAGFIVMGLAVGLPWETWLMHFAAGGLVLLITFGMFAAGWIGGGDAKLAAVTAMWMGWGSLLIEYGAIASLFGGALTLALLNFRNFPLPYFARWPWLLHLHHHKTGVPYGIALAAAGLAVYPNSQIWMQSLSV
ncbi:prepilin peptidase [Alsobacter sp. KACC 23698]|uniref:Prepilin peptidase n=1 Tax=Alsobacter sp. KACC 23698 TaxID=3149229 RepID=A0AAU7JGC9_9HYPH